MKHHATFRFSTPHAGILYATVHPEEEVTGGRSRARVRCEGDALILDVDAADIPALRAALNMWLRLISVADEVHELAIVERASGTEES
jgi:KEOPS complex subunit Pcc1